MSGRFIHTLAAAEPLGLHVVIDCHIPDLECLGRLLGVIANETRVETSLGVVLTRLEKRALGNSMVLRVEDEHDSIPLLSIDELRCELKLLLADADFENLCGGDCAGQGSSSSESGEAHVERSKEGRRFRRRSKR